MLPRCVALLLFSALTASVASQPAGCSCSAGLIPISVDVTIATDPSNTLGLNSTEKRRLQTTFEIFGVLCELVHAEEKYSHAIQMLLHGNTYTTQYWDVNWDGYQNYSYIAHSCSQGISSFAWDNTGAGRSVRPANSTDCQLPTAASVASSLGRDLKSGRVSRILTGRTRRFSKVIAYGHSQGSATLNYAAIVDGDRSPFDGLILTSNIHDNQFFIQSVVVTIPASQENPARWGHLDPGYRTTPDINARYLFYGPDNSTFDPKVLQLDDLTKDAGSKWISAQIKFTYVPAHGFKSPVVELVGSYDQIHCLNNNNVPCDPAKLQVSEAVYFPDSKNFTFIVLDGYGHDLNLLFAAAQEFSILTDLFKSFVC